MATQTPVSVRHLRLLWPGLNPSCPKWLHDRLNGDVTVQGCITGIRLLEKDKTLFTLDDGFDVLVISCKTSNMKYTPSVGESVQITGRCCSFKRQLQLWGNIIVPVDDCDELAWCLELDDYWRTAAIDRRGKLASI